VFDRPRLTQVDGNPCEASLTGHLLFFRNEDVPGVIGWIGSVLGKNNINIGNFSLGRQDKIALAVVETDGVVPETVVKQLLENKALQIVRVVEFKS
jgi:D-3-phosphoglycerate dehydrogenase